MKNNCPTCERKRKDFVFYIRFVRIVFLCLGIAVVSAVCVRNTMDTPNTVNMLFGLAAIAIGAILLAFGDEQIASWVLRR
jgi:uncharacterized ferredoxin-like protein